MVLPSHYWTGPIAALVVLAVVVLICRWVFGTGSPRRAQRPVERADYGLLVPVATTRSAADADALRTRLGEAGIRCTVAEPDTSGARRLLVFRTDAARASDLVHG